MFNVRRALVSVSDKRGLIPFVTGLTELGVEVLSTGGTCEHFEKLDLMSSRCLKKPVSRKSWMAA